MGVTVGRFVYFAMDAAALGEISRGNSYQLGDLVAAQVVRVGGEDPYYPLLNLKLDLDGPDWLWVQGVSEGIEPGTWRWMYSGQEQNTTNQRPPVEDPPTSPSEVFSTAASMPLKSTDEPVWAPMVPEGGSDGGGSGPAVGTGSDGGHGADADAEGTPSAGS